MGRIQIAYVRAFGSGISVARQAAQARRNFSPTQSGPDLARARQAWTGLLLRRRVGTQNRLGFGCRWWFFEVARSRQPALGMDGSHLRNIPRAGDTGIILHNRAADF